MKQYLLLLEDILAHGIRKNDRTGTGTLSVFGRQLHFDLSEGFPLITTKKIHTPSIIHELLWFISGDTNVRYLQQNGISIWNEWADENGNLGEVYGKQWRTWESPDSGPIDQLADVVKQIKSNPDSRRILISAWNVAKLSKMTLPPCHYSFQFWVSEGQLSCMFNMRSVDCFLGLPFNIASYALLTYMLAQQCDLEPGELVFSGGDVHLYQNHLTQTKQQLKRDPYPLPKLTFNRKPPSLFEYQITDFSIIDYQAHPHIKAAVAV